MGLGNERGVAREAVGAAVRFWWISVLRGCLALLLAVGALISGASQPVLVNFIAIYWLLGGILTIRWALGVRWRLLARHALDDIVNPEVLVSVVALTTVATACLRLVGAFEVEKHTGHRWTIGGIILGSVEVCLGAMLFLVRDSQASTVRITIGVWGLVAGSLLLGQGVRMLHLRRAIG